jgi:hypothetical protein
VPAKPEMKFELISLSIAKRKILGNNIAGLNGKRMLRGIVTT